MSVFHRHQMPPAAPADPGATELSTSERVLAEHVLRGLDKEPNEENILDVVMGARKGQAPEKHTPPSATAAAKQLEKEQTND